MAGHGVESAGFSWYVRQKLSETVNAYPDMELSDLIRAGLSPLAEYDIVQTSSLGIVAINDQQKTVQVIGGPQMPINIHKKDRTIITTQPVSAYLAANLKLPPVQTFSIADLESITVLGDAFAEQRDEQTYERIDPLIATDRLHTFLSQKVRPGSLLTWRDDTAIGTLIDTWIKSLREKHDDVTWLALSF
jgi:hypothetical protein